MKQLTIRGVDDKLHTRLRSQAKQQEMSVNRYILYLLKKSTGLSHSGLPQEQTFDDLDHLAGTWTQADAEGFESNLNEQRQIDEELWP